MLFRSFMVGSIGEPGDRQFFIQITSDIGTNTIAISKNQLIALIERFDELVREIRRKKLASETVINSPLELINESLEYPVEEDFHAGVMGITWESDIERVSLEIQEYSELEEFSDLIQIETDTGDLDFPPDILQANITLGQVKSFVALANRVIDAGRKICPFCGLPIDVSGHLCPRANGYKR